MLVHQSQVEAWLSYGDRSAVDEQVRQPTAEVARIRNGIFRRTWVEVPR
jgi:hypothetical protein